MKGMILSIWQSILSLVFAFIIYYLSCLDVAVGDVSNYPFPFSCSSLKSIYPICYNHKIHIIVTLFIILILLHGVLLQRLKKESKHNKYWLKRFLQHVINQDLGGEVYETRITIFCKKAGYKFIIPYLWHYAFTKKFNLAWQNRPRICKSYLTIYERFSFPKSVKSYTFFELSEEDVMKPTSIVADCYKRGVSKHESLPYISEICCPKNFYELSGKEQKLVQEYMNKTGTDYTKLCMLNRKANFIYAVPIRHNQEIWGVVVFDSNHKPECKDLKEMLKNNIDNYQKIIQFTIQLYK